jgi:hypothetical protein
VKKKLKNVKKTLDTKWGLNFLAQMREKITEDKMRKVLFLLIIGLSFVMLSANEEGSSEILGNFSYLKGFTYSVGYTYSTLSGSGVGYAESRDITINSISGLTVGISRPSLGENSNVSYEPGLRFIQRGYGGDQATCVELYYKVSPRLWGSDFFNINPFLGGGISSYQFANSIADVSMDFSILAGIDFIFKDKISIGLEYNRGLFSRVVNLESEGVKYPIDGLYNQTFALSLGLVY